MLDQILSMLPLGLSSSTMQSLMPVFIAIEVIFGVLWLLFGYRLIKFFIFVAGFLVGMTVASILPDSNSFTVLLGGLIGGGLSLALWYLGIFMIGALAGVLLGIALGVNVKEVYYVLAIVGGVLAIVVRKFMIIVSTSWSGATTLVPLAASLFGNHPDERIIFILEILLMAFGIFFQYKTSPKKEVVAAATKTEPDPPEKPAETESSTSTHT